MKRTPDQIRKDTALVEAALSSAAEALGYKSVGEYLQERGFSHGGVRFLAVELLAELERAGRVISIIE